MAGTTVKNPMYRPGQTPYMRCLHCQQMFTRLGVSRHWDKCPKKVKP